MVIDATARFEARRQAAVAARGPVVDPITARLNKLKENLRGPNAPTKQR
jgi:hypothetical protein